MIEINIYKEQKNQYFMKSKIIDRKEYVMYTNQRVERDLSACVPRHLDSGRNSEGCSSETKCNKKRDSNSTNE